MSRPRYIASVADPWVRPALAVQLPDVDGVHKRKCAASRRIRDFTSSPGSNSEAMANTCMGAVSRNAVETSSARRLPITAAMPYFIVVHIMGHQCVDGWHLWIRRTIRRRRSGSRIAKDSATFRISKGSLIVHLVGERRTWFERQRTQREEYTCGL